MDTSALTPKRIIGMEGGMITPSSAAAWPAARRPRGAGSRGWMSAGIRIAPMAKVVAAETGHGRKDHAGEHAGHGQAALHAADDGSWRNSTSRREMPPVSIRLPARMKKGMAASGNLLMALNISLTGDEHVRVGHLDAQHGRQADGHGHRDGEREAQHHRDEHRAGSLRGLQFQALRVEPVADDAR
jgi:hypothetical protein